MFEKIGKILRELTLGISILLVILGVIVLMLGVLGTWWNQILIDVSGISEELLVWSPYVMILGLIVLAFGIWYLYSYFNNKRIVTEGLQTNKRSEFMKKHAEIKKAARRLPSRFLQQLEEKEKQFRMK
jgi:hypothetical protein